MRTRFAWGICLVMVSATGAGCANCGAEEDPGPPVLGDRDGSIGMDGAATDAGRDAGGADTSVGPDTGHGGGAACDPCATGADCMAGFHCVTLMAGGLACLPVCETDLPDCPPRFECVVAPGGTIPDPVCAPVGERCCVDPDADLHGTGLGCLGTDCDEEDPETNSSAAEECDGDDNDCNGTPDDGDPNVLCPRGTHVGETACAGGMCEVIACEPGFADCNRMTIDGCETSTGTLTDCGMCGTPCAPPHATGDCSSGACRVGTCDPGWGDCNMMAMDGCETPTNTLANCGGCGVTCDRPHAADTCTTGMCGIASCDMGWGDCDTIVTTGCETSLRSNADCGGCGTVCAPLHGTGDCSTGMCRLATCMPGWDDCNRDGLSCETSLATNSNCGACGMICSLPGATTSCTTGSCNFTGCSGGYANCDALTTNGCEVRHANVAGSCGTGNVGTWAGDTSCGFICGGNGLDGTPFATRTGVTSAWFMARAAENSSCSASLHHHIELQSPPGADYDLFVYRTCGGAPVGSSSAGTGALDAVDVNQGENSGADDSFDYYIEVRHYGGSSCTPWTLRFYGHSC